jgi:hypothetical protein
MDNDYVDDLEPPSEMQKRSGDAFDRTIGNSVNVGITAWLTNATGSPESAALIGGMIGPFAEELSFAIRKAVNLQQRRSQHMVDEAAERGQVSIEELLDRLLRSPSKVELLLRALEAAARSTTEAKTDLIAELLATGALAEDGAVVDEQRLVVEAIGALETPHFRLLSILDQPSPVWWDTSEERSDFRHAWPETRIIEKDPGLSNVLSALAAKLHSLGMARDVGSSKGKEILWELTTFGSLCIRALHDRHIAK